MGMEAVKENITGSYCLEIKNAYFSYGIAPILQNINLKINEGEIRAIIGPNGAGKSTLLNIISGRNFPQKGKLFFQGKDVTSLAPYRKRQMGISRSFQITNIFPAFTVYENIRLAVQGMGKNRYNIWRSIASDQGIHEETFQLIKECNLTDVAFRDVNELSYAQQRQVEIALVLAKSPKLLLLDEPTAGLSVEESKWIADMIQRIARNHHLTIIFVEHDMDIVFRISNLITVLHYGQVFVEDTPENIRTNPKVQEIYLGTE